MAILKSAIRPLHPQLGCIKGKYLVNFLILRYIFDTIIRLTYFFATIT